METVAHLRFLDPYAVVAAAGIASGARVVDFGCAAGYFTVPCAEAVGDSGVVIAIDVLPSALEAVESAARIREIRTITTRCANVEKMGGSQEQDNSADWVILKNVLFMNADRLVILQEAHRILKEGGRVLLIEWNDHLRGIGPDAEQRLSRDACTALARDAGFQCGDALDVGAYHYGVILTK